MDQSTLIECMNKFAADTKNDKLSVIVARVAGRLLHEEHLRLHPLTQHELKIISYFKTPNK